MSVHSGTYDEDLAVPTHPDGYVEEGLIDYLEPDQLVAETFRPVPRAPLAKNVAIGLWALRVFVVLVSLMVLYTFVARLH